MAGMWSLAPLSILIGAVLLWFFGRVSNQKEIREARRRLQACLYELRLFVDEPRLVWRAQIALLRANFRYLALMLYPVVLLTIPMVLIFAALEPFYGKMPLRPGSATVVTIKMAYPLNPSLPPPILQGPPGVSVETPAVRVLGEREVSWRIRALRPTAGDLRVVLPTEIIKKSVVSGTAPRLLSERRVRAIWNLLLHPTEARLPEGAVEWIEVRYPSRSIGWLGLHLHWLVWFFVLSMVTALLLKRTMRVTF